MSNIELYQIIQESKRGIQRSQNTLMNLFWDKIYYFILSKTHNKAEAEDITIRTFTKVFKKLKLYNDDFDFYTWVKAIAYNTMIDQLRKKKHNNISLDDELNPIDIEAAMPSPEQYLISKQNAKKLNAEIENLPPIYREVIELRYLEDKTYKEIAEALDLTLSNVKVRLLRAKKLLEDSISM
ncbi:Sigma-24 [Candidatus Ornithobacterium hominis]|uniref:Sigma-24 n=1 Tax=Candidatus Ornithobacterium hominis TaxID=2497989 RepID=A0A383U239_9FLAO|nr:RNA polymerase sigma factor [Candidatus Ornithobacterium hominis]MCT7904952.1 RNA polymerase sigma factor [Candidatus Ornithobacterium hominis]SZD73356.1 Sigma-24 [Candidatus Ornithobacterium hominis]SZD73459.1 Sigma-24 [Candidatus Ornithobacterium hominis]